MAEQQAAAAQPAQVTINNQTPNDFPEMPYSWNARMIGAEGFEEQFTVRAVNDKPFLQRVARLKAELIAAGYKPIGRSAAQAASTPEAESVPNCAIHGTPMAKRTGKGGNSFWSCPKKLDNGEWCPYRPK